MDSTKQQDKTQLRGQRSSSELPELTHPSPASLLAKPAGKAEPANLSPEPQVRRRQTDPGAGEAEETLEQAVRSALEQLLRDLSTGTTVQLVAGIRVGRQTAAAEEEPAPRRPGLRGVLGEPPASSAEPTPEADRKEAAEDSNSETEAEEPLTGVGPDSGNEAA